VADAPELVREMLAREQLVSTAIGDGMALPHAREPAAVAGRYGLTIGIAPEGIAFAAPDRRPVTIFVLVCADSVPRHLALMAQVVLALREAAVRRAWREARQPGDVLTALIRHEQRKLME
jgi:mannitol/fructose-specific phosphotransferase system IIA component